MSSLEQSEAHGQERAVSAVVAVCRVGVALQAVGVALQRLGLPYGYEDESPLFGLLAFDWQWSEQLALQLDDLSAWLYLVCGLGLLAIPLLLGLWQRVRDASKPPAPVWIWQLPLCCVVAGCQLLIMLVTWYRGGSFMSEWTIASQAARLVLPLALLLLTPVPWSKVITQQRLSTAVWLLRIAISLTYFAHGLKAWYLSPAFTDFLIVAANHIAWDLSQSNAESLLTVIAIVDIAVALLIVAVRWRAVAFYMAAWAFIAALARMVHSGWGAHFEVLLRAGNYCVPLAVGLTWQLLRSRKTNKLDQKDHNESP